MTITGSMDNMEMNNNAAPELSALSNSNSTVTGSPSKTWGWLPALSLTSAVGVFLVALAGDAGRAVSQWSDSLFWLGMVVLLLPIALRLLSPKPTRRERIALLVILVSLLYLIRDLDYPLSFAYNDEFLFWRGAQDIAMSGHLFRTNPLTPIAPFYPGLDIVINALSNLTGLSIFVSGIIVLEVAGLVLVLSLYLFFEYLSSSAQIAGIATFLYMGNINQFGTITLHYQSLAEPLAAFVLFATFRRAWALTGRNIGLSVAIWLGLAAAVITHHLTSYVLVAFLFLWMAIFLFPRVVPSFHHLRTQKDWVGPGGAAVLGLVLCILWLIYTGEMASGYTAAAYLGDFLNNTMHQSIQILTGQIVPRQLFHDNSGVVAAPLWQRVTSFTSIGLIFLGLPFGLFQIWRRYRANAVALALAVVVLPYPISLLIRLTHAGVEISGRSQAFLFVGIGFVLAVGITHFWLSCGPNWRSSALVVGAMVIIFIGGWINGTQDPSLRLPGPYLPSADARSREPEGVQAAVWAGSYLGSGQRMISDRDNMLLLATYGYERIVSDVHDGVSVSWVFLSPHFDSSVEMPLQRGRVQYIVVDRRLSTGLPRYGFYFDAQSELSTQYTKPLDPAKLAKFDDVQNLSRIFDSGDISIYNVEAITNGSSTTSTQQSLCTPAPSTAVSSSYPKVAKLYAGTIYDIPTGLKTNLSLRGIQQQQGSICGYFSGMPSNALFNRIPTNGPFTGTTTTDKQIQFTLTNERGQATFSFEGVILQDGSLEGTYCNVGTVTGQCSDYGLWSASPPGS